MTAPIVTAEPIYGEVWIEGEDRFGSCSLCGSIVAFEDRHSAWHAGLTSHTNACRCDACCALAASELEAQR
jgi:hypothetical protein